jgi:hypothetical protein
MQIKVPIEPSMDMFVQEFGGKLIRELIPNVNPDKNADYLFDSPLVVAELKCVERGGFTIEDKAKLDELAKDWMRRGLIQVFGRTVINLRNVPVECQREWMKIHLAPWKRKLERANAQIKQTKLTFNVTSACGLLLLVRDAPSTIDPRTEMDFIARILQSRKEDGSHVYSHLNRIVYFSVNPGAVTQDGIGMNFWIPAYRTENEPRVSEFLKGFRDGWIQYHRRLLGKGASQIPTG